MGVDYSTLTGSGPSGRIVAKDIYAAAEAQKAAPAAAAAAPAPAAAPAAKTNVELMDGDTVVKLSGMRKVVAERMLQSHTEIPPVTQNTKVDVTELMKFRKMLLAETGSKYSVNDLVLKAIAKCLTKHPEILVSFDEANHQIIQRKHVNIGMAVALDAGLITPVIRDADKMGLELKIEDMEFDSIITAVSTGKADLGLAGMTVTPDRQKNVDFSDTYANGVQVIIVKEDSAIAKPDDLKGKKIGVQLSTTGDLTATDEFGKDSVVQYNKGNDAVMALTQGQVDAVIIDNEPAKSYVEANKGLKILDTEFLNEDYAACISKDNAGLTKAVNKALAELKADGTLQKIVDKYIKA